MIRPTVTPFLWTLFSAGGVLAALLIPVLLFLFGLAFPLGWITPPAHAHLLALLGHPLSRAGLLVLLVLSLCHWAHRFRYTLYDGLQIKHLNELILLVCYGGALVGAVVAVLVIRQIP